MRLVDHVRLLVAASSDQQFAQQVQGTPVQRNLHQALWFGMVLMILAIAVMALVLWPGVLPARGHQYLTWFTSVLAVALMALWLLASAVFAVSSSVCAFNALYLETQQANKSDHQLEIDN